MPRTKHTLASVVIYGLIPSDTSARLNSLCLHMIGHVFLIIPQKLPDASQLEAQIAVPLVRFVRAVSVERSRLEFPSRLSRVHTSNKGREEG